MAYLIGTDEAGYGPNLGPLVIAASVWQVPDGALNRDLYDLFGPRVANQMTAAPDCLAIADSKQLYRAGGGLAQLERTLLTLLDANRTVPTTARRLRETLCGNDGPNGTSLPWDRDFDVDLPVSSADTIDPDLTNFWRQTCETTGVRLVSIRATLIQPEEFNQAVNQYDSKGALLSHRTLDLLSGLIDKLDQRPVRVVCDKHGGRNHYGALLQPRFDDRLVRIVDEGPQTSTYEVGTAKRPIRITFQVGGESFLPSALASMAAKYLRELDMLAFNRFWQQHLPTLRPTAGYPGDAARFWDDIRGVQRRLGIDDAVLWRCR
jgi:ribonuclease HII